ncbi:MAG: hypothetical protein KJ899_10350 [Gammaproteobacteria bacterium]|nr:hypothetical protein [Gammaproteobacteria bacterium]
MPGEAGVLWLPSGSSRHPFGCYPACRHSRMDAMQQQMAKNRQAHLEADPAVVFCAGCAEARGVG